MQATPPLGRAAEKACQRQAAGVYSPCDMKKRRVVILGSTGSIGTSALKVARAIPDRMEVVALAACGSVDKIAEQAREFGVKTVCLYDPGRARELQRKLPGARVLAGMEGLCELATLPDADMILVSIIGTAGLKPTLEAIEAGKDLAIASKEILVMAGEVVMARAAAKGVHVLPVDSEHNAIFQCLQGEGPGAADRVARLILTASGGPFRATPAEDLERVTLEQALKHPTWSMGRKITIDSATLVNKGLEMIEARWLFGVPMERVDVLVHPQSIVHSLVEYRDGSILAQLSSSDMCFPIQYAVTWPDRTASALPRLDLAQIAALRFEAPRWNDFPALRIARDAGLAGGTAPAMFNAANEVAVQAFIDGRLSFPGIWRTVESVLGNATPRDYQGRLDLILEDDAWAREEACRVIAR